MESIHEFVIDRLQAAKGGWPTIAEGSGVPLRTLEKVARRENADPRVGTVEKLARYFHELERETVATN